MRKLTEESFDVRVDYSQSLSQMIAIGGYDKVSAEINARNFRLERSGFRPVEMLLVQPYSAVSPLELVAMMKPRRFCPAFIEELLALGKEQPGLQRKIPIVALGSGRIIHGRRHVVCLAGGSASRSLALAVIYRRWSIYYRFAFVRE
jgi:hypothetical protein